VEILPVSCEISGPIFIHSFTPGDKNSNHSVNKLRTVVNAVSFFEFTNFQTQELLYLGQKTIFTVENIGSLWNIKSMQRYEDEGVGILHMFGLVSL
jgi:hypothetical protein